MRLYDLDNLIEIVDNYIRELNQKIEEYMVIGFEHCGFTKEYVGEHVEDFDFDNVNDFPNQDTYYIKHKEKVIFILTISHGKGADITITLNFFQK